jgi:hypothetical protein
MKRPNLVISSFKKDKSLKLEKGQIKVQIFKICHKIKQKFWNFRKCCMFYWNLARIGLKRHYFLQDRKKAIWPNHFISRKLFQKGQMATLGCGPKVPHSTNQKSQCENNGEDVYFECKNFDRSISFCQKGNVTYIPNNLCNIHKI